MGELTNDKIFMAKGWAIKRLQYYIASYSLPIDVPLLVVSIYIERVSCTIAKTWQYFC